MERSCRLGDMVGVGGAVSDLLLADFQPVQLWGSPEDDRSDL